MMEHPGFFHRAGPFPLSMIAAALTGKIIARPSGGDDTSDAEVAGRRTIADVKPLSSAGPRDLAFLDNKKYLDQLGATRAAACLIAQAFVDRVPPGTIPIVVRNPYRAFALVLATIYPDSQRSKTSLAEPGAPLIHPTATIEAGAVIEPGAVIGREAWIGSDCLIAANAVIGYRCTVGRGSYIGPGASLTHALIGNRVILHAGVRIGQDGFGFVMSAQGHLKVPQIGRVIIQDDVEIGANSAVDRGALGDTVIGEGTKIDNLVQIGHNVMIGRHCIIVGQVGIAGSTELGDGVVIGGQSGVAGHLKIGAGTRIAGASHVKDDVAAGLVVGGTPAKPFKQWARELAAIELLAQRKVPDVVPAVAPGSVPVAGVDGTIKP